MTRASVRHGHDSPQNRQSARPDGPAGRNSFRQDAPVARHALFSPELKLPRQLTSQSLMSDHTMVSTPSGGFKPKKRFNPWERPSWGSLAGNRGSAEKTEEVGQGTFIDIDKMKEKVRQSLMKPQYNVQDYYKTEGYCQALARNPLFETLTLAVISVNALWIWIDTDNNQKQILLEAHPVFQVAEHVFCTFFTFELLVRWCAFSRKCDSFKDAWFTFDFILVVMMVLETWVLTLFIAVGGNGSEGMGNASVLRIARLLRLSRMTRMARLLRAMPELMILIKGMVSATRSVFFTFCLLTIVMYIFAIAFTQLTTNTNLGDLYFSTVPHSMYTLWVHGALLDNVSTFAAILNKEMIWITPLFFVYVCLAALTIMNMLIGVLCEVVSTVAATEKEGMLVKYVHTKLRKVMSLLDDDGNGQMSKKEFVQILENGDAVQALYDVGVDAVGLVDYADFIFEDGDDDDAGQETGDRQLDFAEFMDLVLELRGQNQAKVKDVVDLRKFFRSSFARISKEIAMLNMRLIQSEPNDNAVTPDRPPDSPSDESPKPDLPELPKPDVPKDNVFQKQVSPEGSDIVESAVQPECDTSAPSTPSFGISTASKGKQRARKHVVRFPDETSEGNGSTLDSTAACSMVAPATPVVPAEPAQRVEPEEPVEHAENAELAQHAEFVELACSYLAPAEPPACDGLAMVPESRFPNLLKSEARRLAEATWARRGSSYDVNRVGNCPYGFAAGGDADEWRESARGDVGGTYFDCAAAEDWNSCRTDHCSPSVPSTMNVEAPSSTVMAARAAVDTKSHDSAWAVFEEHTSSTLPSCGSDFLGNSEYSRTNIRVLYGQVKQLAEAMRASVDEVMRIQDGLVQVVEASTVHPAPTPPLALTLPKGCQPSRRVCSNVPATSL